MRSNPLPNFLDRMRDGDFPLTKWIVVLCVVLIFASVFQAPVQYLTFTAPDSLRQPWTFFTYPLVMPDPISLLFYALNIWWMGGSLERSWGTRFYAALWIALAVLGALCVSLAAFALGASVTISGWIPVVALIAVWCSLNAGEQISLWGVVPMLAKWLGIGAIAILFLMFAQVHPLIGLAAIMPSVLGWWWVRNRDLFERGRFSVRRVSTQKRKPNSPRDDATLKLNPLERFQRARRKKQFERLMKDD